MRDMYVLLDFLEKRKLRDWEERREKDARGREERLKPLELVFAVVQWAAKTDKTEQKLLWYPHGDRRGNSPLLADSGGLFFLGFIP